MSTTNACRPPFARVVLRLTFFLEESFATPKTKSYGIKFIDIGFFTQFVDLSFEKMCNFIHTRNHYRYKDPRNYKITHNTKNYMKTPWRHMLCGNNLCKLKNINKETATRLKQQNRHSFIHTNLITMSYPSKKMGSEQ